MKVCKYFIKDSRLLSGVLAHVLKQIDYSDEVQVSRLLRVLLTCESSLLMTRSYFCPKGHIIVLEMYCIHNVVFFCLLKHNV